MGMSYIKIIKCRDCIYGYSLIKRHIYIYISHEEGYQYLHRSVT
jgi:hypothetical protein